MLFTVFFPTDSEFLAIFLLRDKSDGVGAFSTLSNETPQDVDNADFMMVLLELIVFWLDYCALVITNAPPLDLNDFIVHATWLNVAAYKYYPPCEMHQPFVPAVVHHLMWALTSHSTHAHSYSNACLQRHLSTVLHFLH